MPRPRLDPRTFSTDTLEFLRALAQHDVRYVIVGGQAVVYYGHSRLTGDVDFFYDSEPANAESLFAALLDFWSGSIPGLDRAVELTEPGLILQFGLPPNRLDLINRVDGLEFEEAWDSRVVVEVAGADGSVTPVNMISLDKLIQNKQASGRPKDLDDLRFLKAARG